MKCSLRCDGAFARNAFLPRAHLALRDSVAQGMNFLHDEAARVHRASARQPAPRLFRHAQGLHFGLLRPEKKNMMGTMQEDLYQPFDDRRDGIVSIHGGKHAPPSAS